MAEGTDGVNGRRIRDGTGDQLHVVAPILKYDGLSALGAGKDAGEIAFGLGNLDRLHESRLSLARGLSQAHGQG